MPRSGFVRRLRLPAVAGLALLAGASGGAASAQAEPADGRHAELISGLVDPGKQAGFMYPDVSSDGDSVVWAADGAQSSSGQGGITAAFVARRSELGWASTDASLPGTSGGPDGLQFSEPTLLPPGAQRLLVRATGQHDSSTPFSSGLPHLFEFTPGETTGRSLLRAPFQDATDVSVVPGQQTLSSVYFTTAGSPGPPAPDVVAEDGTVLNPFVIARRDADQSIAVASRLPDGSVTDQQSAAAPAVDVPLFTEFDPNGDFQRRTPRAGVGRGGVSVDGRRLYFYAYDADGRAGQLTDSAGGPLQPLFVRDGARTVAVSESEVDGEAKPARLLGASPDGDVSYFVADEALDGTGQGAGVYRYQLSSGDPLTRITPTVSSAATIDSLEIRTGEVSRDASTVYFVTSANMGGGAQPGGRNAYVWRDGGLRFIADLGAAGRLRRVARSGQYAVFSTTDSLAGANTGGFSQLYRYSYAGDDLRCASCRSGGAPNEAASDFTQRPGSLTNPPISARGVADDGHVFFTTPDRLVESDGVAGDDVYEFTGTSVRLLSGGTGASDLLDNSDDGQRVYLSTREAMTPEDPDGGDVDVYVRRPGSDFARPVPATPCAGDACQGSATGTPARPAAGSENGAPGRNLARRRRTAGVLLSSPAVTRSALARLARGETASVRIRVRGEGRLVIRGFARVGGRQRLVASGSVTGRKEGSRIVRVPLKLNAVGLLALRRSGELRVRLEARSDSGRTRTATLTLRRAGR